VGGKNFLKIKVGQWSLGSSDSNCWDKQSSWKIAQREYHGM